VKVLLQRVSRAAVRVDGAVVGKVATGFVALVGVERGDTEADAAYFAAKTAELRVFPDARGKMNRSVLEARGAVLVVSQFTLAASTRRGRRPSFDAAAPPEAAEPLCRAFGEQLAARGVPVETGVFRAHMEVELVNDGPVTILLDPRPANDGA
jgi:D-tyrosyl-tRNA(Tyr) deacylase